MKKYLLITVMLSIVLSACGRASDSSSEESIPLPQTAEIFLIDRYENHAWGYVDRGLFADTSGSVYAFDFGMLVNHMTSDEQMFEKFDIIRDNTEPVMILDNDVVIELYSLGSMINPESEFHSKHAAYDAGSSTISFCNPDTGRMTVCIEHGDYEGRLDDRYAKKIVRLYEKLEKLIYGTDPEFIAPLIYTAEDIRLNVVECEAEISGKYFLSSEEELRILARQSGTSIDDMLSDFADYEHERYVYFVELNSAPANAIIRTGDSYQFTYSDSSGSGFCNVAAYPRTSCAFNADGILCMDDGKWQML